MKRYIITVLYAFVAYCAWGQLTHQTNVPHLSQYQINIVGDSCVELLAQNIKFSSHPEQPELPVFYYTFILPTHSHIISVEPLSRSVTQRTIPLPIKCAPPAMTANGEISRTNMTDENTPQYLTDELYVVSDGYFDGDIHLVTIAYSPINYVRGAKKFTYATIPQFVIRFQSGAPEGMRPITPPNRNRSKRIAMIQKIVDNPQNVSAYVPTTPTVSSDSILLGNTQNLPGIGYEYLVITTRKLYDTAQKLADWKRSKGVYAGVVCYEDIRDTCIIDTLVEYNEIDDAAGHLRKYLRNAYAYGLQYAFLVSEKGEIPYRKYYDSDEHCHATPTDFYYVDLQNEWNKFYSDYDSYSFNESIQPDIAIGRLFVSDNTEWSNYIDRLITYERNPGCGDPYYLGKYFTIQSDQLQKNSSGTKVANILSSRFSNIVTWGENPSYNDTTMSVIWPKGKDVIDELQNNPCGYFATYAHGGQMWTTTFSGGMDCKSGDVGYHRWIIRSVENDTITDRWQFNVLNNGTKMEVGAGIDNLNLPNNPFIVYSISCTTMPYDTVVPTQNPVTIGEAFTTKSKSAVAYLGNTRVGWINPSDSLHLVFNKILLSGFTNIGIVENLSKTMYNFSNYKSFKKYLAAAHNILGCPEIPMWTAIPQKTTNVANSDLVYVTPLFNNASPQQMTYSEVQSNSLYNQNHSIARIRQNFYPFFLPIKLQNITLQSKHTIFGADIEIGRSATSNSTQGNFVIGESGELNIETTGTVTLKQGTVIKTGGMLSIKHIKQ